MILFSIGLGNSKPPPLIHIQQVIVQRMCRIIANGKSYVIEVFVLEEQQLEVAKAQSESNLWYNLGQGPNLSDRARTVGAGDETPPFGTPELVGSCASLARVWGCTLDRGASCAPPVASTLTPLLQYLWVALTHNVAWSLHHHSQKNEHAQQYYQILILPHSCVE